MALVADYGISSDEEQEEGEEKTEIKLATPPENSFKSDEPVPRSLQQDSDDDGEEESVGLGKFLPKPKPKRLGEDVEGGVEVGPIPPMKTYGEELPKPPTTTFHNITATKVKGIVKIAAPSLKDFEDDDKRSGSSQKFLQSSIKKGSGLFSLLPQPKGMSSTKEIPASFLKASATVKSIPTPTKEATTIKLQKSLIPDSVKNAGKRPPPSKLEEIKAKYLKQDANVRIVSRPNKTVGKTKEKDSDDSDEEEGSSFFTFDSGADDIDEETLEKLKLPMPDFSQKVSQVRAEESKSATYEEEEAETSSAHYMQPPDLAKYLPKQKGKISTEVNFIDVNADDLRPDSTEWVKNITDESAIPPRRGKGLGGMQKRKHQITYLAVEAKAREQELQQQWAQNRQTRRQTQMKYGF